MPKEETKPAPVKDEIATASKDIDMFSGWLNRLENPDPTLRTEAAGKGLKLYDEVDRDPHAGSVLQSRYLSVIAKEWEVLPGEELPVMGRPKTITQAQKIADFVKATLEQTNFDQARQELLQAILYGFYVGEVMWVVRDNAVLPKKIRAKHPNRFSFTMDRELRLLTLDDAIDGVPVPDRKFLRFTYGSSDNPYGKGLGQKLWWPVWFKKHGIKFWMVFLEKYGMPTAIGKYAPGTDPEQQDALLDAIDAIQNETGIKIPDTMEIDLLEAVRAGKVTYETLCEYMDKQVSKAVLGQTATTEGTPGKLGNEEAQQETRQDIVEADAGLLDECLNDSLVKWIVDYNFPGVTAYPQLHTRTEAEKDLKALAERDKILTNDIGVPVSRRYFYETYSIDEPEEGEEVVGGQRFRSEASRGRETRAQKREARQSAKGEQAQEKAKKALEELAGSFMEGKAAAFSRADVDDLIERASIGSNQAVESLLEPVIGLVNQAASFKEIGERLYDLYPDMESKQFQDLLARAMFATGLVGYGASESEGSN